MNLTLVVLAAGLGSRYGGLKQIEPVGPSGETLMDYALYDAQRAGFHNVVFVIQSSMLHDLRASRWYGVLENLHCDYVVQELTSLPESVPILPERTKPWGTGHAVWTALEHITEPFAIINADDFYGARSYRLMAEFLQQRKNVDTQHCMVGYRLERTLSAHGTVSRGICRVDDGGLLESVVERTKIFRDGDVILSQNADNHPIELQPDDTVSMNMFGFTPAVKTVFQEQFVAFFEQLPVSQRQTAEFYLPSVVQHCISSGQGTVRVLQSPETWFGLTYQEDKPAARERISECVKNEIYPNPLWQTMKGR